MRNTINHELMRSINKRYILDFIRKNGPVSKKEIATRLDLSFTSVTTFVGELLTEETIVHHGSARSIGGRKSELFLPNPDAFYVCGVDIQTDRLVLLFQNFSGAILNQTEIRLEQTGERHVASLINTSIPHLYHKLGLPENKLTRIGVSVPGIVNPDSGVVELAPNLHWKQVDFKSMLTCDLPVVMANEANAAAIGELYFGSARKAGNAIFISVGSGIGTGLIFDHHLFEGRNFLAGEFGHMTLDPHGPVCRCGKRGCWETYASNNATLALYQQLSATKLTDYDQLLDLYLQNEAVAQKTIQEEVYYLGIGVANLVNGLNPEMIVIGGSIAKIRDMIYPQLFQTVKRESLDSSFQGVGLQFSEFANHAAALGAASMAIDRQISSEK